MMLFEVANNPLMSSISLWNFWGLGSLVVSLISIVYYWRTTTIQSPASIPWVGVRNEALQKFRAWIRELSAGLTTLDHGYLTHNKTGKSFVLLDTAGRPNVILPKESIRWLVGQPDHVLNAHKVLNTRFAIDYLAPHFSKKLNESLNLAVRRDLTRNLGKTQKTSFDIMRERIDRLWGLQNSWHEVNLFSSLQSIVSSVNRQLLMGETLYRNEGFIRSLDNFMNVNGICSILIGQFMPPFIAPVIGYPASLLVYMLRRKALKYLHNEIKHRMKLIQQHKADPDFSYEPPLDFVHWFIMACLDANVPEMADLLLSVSLASQGTIIVSIRTMLDLLSSPAEFKYFGAIASEAASIFQNEEDFGNVESLHKLSRIDSAIRESARLNPTTGRGMMHEVVHKNGVILPDGNKVCHGTWLGVSVVGINQDERYYADPHKYDPFRFSRARTEAALTMGGTKNTDSLNKETGEKLKATVPNKPNGSWLSTAQEEFGTFGYGRHSCPGRWFASHVMKMMIAYIALKYEIQQIKECPPNMVLGDIIIPPQNVKIMVRRKISV